MNGRIRPRALTIALALLTLSACANGKKDPPLVAPIVGHTYPVTTPSDARDDVPATYGDDAPPPTKIVVASTTPDGELLVDEIIVSNCALERGTRRMKFDGLDVHAGVGLDALADCLADATMEGTLISIIGYSDPPDGVGLRRADALATALSDRAIAHARIDTYARPPQGTVADAVVVRLDQ
jgi:hypothetical protein